MSVRKSLAGQAQLHHVDHSLFFMFLSAVPVLLYGPLSTGVQRR